MRHADIGGVHHVASPILFGGTGGGTNGDAAGANGNSTEQLFTFR